MRDHDDRLDAAAHDIITWRIRPRSAARDHSVDPRDLHTHTWQIAKTTVRRRDNDQCQRCGQHGTHDVHHRIPRGMGGANTAHAYRASNLLTLCRACHHHVEQHRAAARDQGHLVPTGIDPEHWETIDHAGRAWLLHDDGTRTRAPHND